MAHAAGAQRAIVGRARDASGRRLTSRARTIARRDGVGRANAMRVRASADDAMRVKKLQNGSDIRGVALDGVEGEAITLDAATASAIGRAFADWLRARNPNAKDISVGVGRDPRLSGETLRDGMFAGMVEGGARVIDMGLATTPACFMACVTEGAKYDGSVMLTASHLPFNRNGMKFFTSEGGLDKPDITDICARAAAYVEAGVGSVTAPSGVVSAPFLPTYAAQLCDIIRKGVNSTDNYDKPLTGMKIVVDAGNGSGGFFADMVLEALGADTSGSQFLDPNGNFPNHSPNPEDKEAMAAGVQCVLNAKADLGIVFDTDVDRSAVIDSSGKEINRNKLIALLSEIVLKESPGATIVTDSVTSDGLHKFITAKGGKHVRFMRGYKNVINKGKELNASGVVTPLMIETSGHGAMKENYDLDDGAYLAVKIIIEAVRRRLANEPSIGQVLETLEEPLEEAEVRLKIADPDFKAYGLNVIENLLAAVNDPAHSLFGKCKPAPDNYEGLRVCVDEGDGRQGWFLLRCSLHDPVMVLNFESQTQCGVQTMAEEFGTWILDENYDKLDGSAVYALYDTKDCPM
jgi:phosphomannomutase